MINQVNTATALKPLAVTVPIALTITGIGRTKLYELLADKKLESVMIGSRRLIKYESLEALIGIGAK